MIDYLPYFIGSGFLIVILIVFNHKKQKSRLNEFVKAPEEAPSLLMVQSVERKLKVIYGNLYPDGVKPSYATGEKSTATGQRQKLILELEGLEAAYAAKQISLREYSDKLQTLQMNVFKL